MNIFSFSEYRDLIKAYVAALPGGGHGEYTRMASQLKVNSTLISQVMKGRRDFTAEQAYELTDFFGMSEQEAEYFLLLVEKEKAGTVKLKKFYEQAIQRTQSNAKKIVNRVKHARQLSDQERAIFYSSWLYSAIRLYCSTFSSGVDANEITKKFHVPHSLVMRVLKFLVTTGLCEEKENKFFMKEQNTFVEQGSPYLIKHHANWRVKAIQKSEVLTEDEMMFTSPLSISKKDFQSIREELLKFIVNASKKIHDSEPEEIACLNIDFFFVDR